MAMIKAELTFFKVQVQGGAVEAAYIALPNNLHEDYCVRGK
jgi:hypothetical protein